MDYLPFIIIVATVILLIVSAICFLIYLVRINTFSGKLEKADFSEVVFRPEYAIDKEDFIFKVKNSIYRKEYQGDIFPIYKRKSRVIERILFVSGSFMEDITLPNCEESAQKIQIDSEKVHVILGLRKGYYKDHCGHPAFRRENSWVVFFDSDTNEKWGVVNGLRSVSIMDRFAVEKKWVWVADEDSQLFWGVVREMELKKVG